MFSNSNDHDDDDQHCSGLHFQEGDGVVDWEIDGDSYYLLQNYHRHVARQGLFFASPGDRKVLYSSATAVPGSFGAAAACP